jgi:hypothetical protein
LCLYCLKYWGLGVFSHYWQYWGLNSGPQACLIGLLPLEPLHQSFGFGCFSNRVMHLHFLHSWNDRCMPYTQLLLVEMGSLKLFSLADLKPQYSRSPPPK